MTKSSDENELQLLDLWSMAKDYKLLLISVPLFFGIIAIIVTLKMEPIWEASFIVEIGQADKSGRLIEDPYRVMEKVTQSSRCKSSHSKESTVATPIGQSNLIQIRIKRYSKKSLSNSASTCILFIQNSHNEIISPVVSDFNNQFARVEAHLKELKLEIDELKNYTKNKLTNTELLILKTLLQNTKILEQDLENRKITIKKELALFESFPTRQFDKIIIAKESTSNRFKVISLGFILGIFLAIVMMFFHRSLTKDES